MRSLYKLLLVTIGLFAVTACAPPVIDTSADESALRHGTKAWVSAYTAGDADKIVALYADGAVTMPPDALLITGHEALRKFLLAEIAKSKAAGLSYALGEESTGIAGSLGWHSGTFKVYGAGSATVGTGKYLQVWRRTEGKWLMIRDIWNYDAPATATPAK